MDTETKIVKERITKYNAKNRAKDSICLKRLKSSQRESANMSLKKRVNCSDRIRKIDINKNIWVADLGATSHIIKSD